MGCTPDPATATPKDYIPLYSRVQVSGFKVGGLPKSDGLVAFKTKGFGFQEFRV